MAAKKKADAKKVEAKKAAPKKAKPVAKKEEKAAPEKAKHFVFELPENLGNDWDYYRPIGYVRAKLLELPVSIKDGSSYQDFEPGDYVVVDHNGNLFGLAGDVMREQFTPVPPSKMDTHFNQTP